MLHYGINNVQLAVQIVQSYADIYSEETHYVCMYIYVCVCVCMIIQTAATKAIKIKMKLRAASSNVRSWHTQTQRQHAHIHRYGRTVALETEHGGQTLTFLCVPQPISRQQQSAKKKKQAK